MTVTKTYCTEETKMTTTCPDHPDIVSAETTGYAKREMAEPCFFCSNCCETIYAGENYADVYGEKICVECISGMMHIATR